MDDVCFFRLFESWQSKDMGCDSLLHKNDKFTYNLVKNDDRYGT